MRDYHAIFNKWSEYSIADLQLRDEVGAKIELATRLKDSTLGASAVREMDNDTYNILSALKLLEGDNFEENVRRYESTLVPALTIGRTLDLQFDSDVLLYAINKLLPVAQGLLGNIVKHLNILQNKVISNNCVNFQQLLVYHYSEFAICLLNYKWLRTRTSENNLRQLQTNLLNTLFSKESEFLEDDKILIKEILRDHNVQWDNVRWTKSLDCKPVKNTENWKWLHSLCKTDELAIECIKVDILDEGMVERFNLLNNYEKIICCNHALAKARSKEMFTKAIERVNFQEYLMYLGEGLNTEVFNHAIDIDLINLEDYPLDVQINYVKGIDNKKAFEFFMSHSGVQNVNVIKTGYFLNASACYKIFLNDEENRAFISKVLEIVYNTADDSFVSLLSELLTEAKIVKLYTPETLKPIVQTLRETFKNEVSSYKINKILRNVLGDEEYEKIQALLREQEELQKLQEKEEETAESIKTINNSFNNCISFTELLAEYKKFITSYRFENDLVNNILLQTIEKYDDCWEHDDSYTRLYYALWDANKITHEIFLQMVSTESEVA